MDRELALRGANFVYTKGFKEKIADKMMNYAAKVSDRMAETFKDPFSAFVESVVKANGIDKKEEAPVVIQKPQEIYQPTPKIEKPTQVFNIDGNVDYIDAKKVASNTKNDKTAVLTPTFLNMFKNAFKGKKSTKEEEPTMVQPEVFNSLPVENIVQLPEAVTENATAIEEKSLVTPVDRAFFESLPIEQIAPVEIPVAVEQTDIKPEEAIEIKENIVPQAEEVQLPASVEITPIQKIEDPDVDFNTIADGITSLVSQNETLKTKVSTLETNAENLLKKTQEQANQLASLQAKLQKVARENHDMSLEMGQVKSERDSAISEKERVNKAYDSKVVEMEAQVQSERDKDAAERERMSKVYDTRVAELEATVESRVEEGIKNKTIDFDRFKKATARVLVEHGVIQNSQPTNGTPNLDLQKVA